MTSKIAPEEQFDFWLGEWNVTWDDDQHGTNHVTKILNGRVIHENFNGNPGLDFRGMSLSVYNARSETWQQTWVDTEGNYWDFTGSFENERMVLGTEVEVDDHIVLLRMVFYNITSDELDWDWESSKDNGKTWQLKWRLHYSRIMPE